MTSSDSNLFSSHTFCKKCLVQALTPSSSSTSLDSGATTPTTKCPFDRSPLSNSPSDIWPAPVIISNLANDLVVCCPNKSRGCSHTCQRWLIDSHLQQDCQYAQFQCQGAKDDGSTCHEPLEKRYIYSAREIAIQDYNDTKNLALDQSATSAAQNLKIGLTESSPTKTAVTAETDTTADDNENKTNVNTTENSIDGTTLDEPSLNDSENSTAPKPASNSSAPKSEEVKYSDLTVYCPHELMACPNGCGSSFPRYSFESHIESECYNGESACPICDMKLLQKDIPLHLSVCPDFIVPCDAAEYGCVWVGKRHLLLSEHQRLCKFVTFLPALNKQNGKIERLEQENKTLRYKLDKILAYLPETVSSSAGLKNTTSTPSALTTRPSSSRRFGPRVTSHSSSSSSNSNGSIFDNFRFTDSDLMHMFMEGERLREDVDRLNGQFGDMEMRHGVAMMQESFRTGEEISTLRGLINSVRHQIHFLLSERRSWAFSMQQYQQQQMYQQQHVHQHQQQASSPVNMPANSLASSSSSESLLQDTPRRLSGKFLV